MDAAPFEIRDGVVHLEAVPLPALAEDLAGLPGAWLVSRAAVEQALACDGPRAVSPARLAPPALLALAAAAGHWAAVRSAHELQAALAAGFPGERLAVRGTIKEDGLLRDALAAGAAVIEGDAAERAVLERIAAALGHPLPAAAGAPDDLPPDAFARCGGLLARALRGAPEVALDAELDPALAEGAVATASASTSPGDPDASHAGRDAGPGAGGIGAATLVLALAGLGGETVAGTLAGLSGLDGSPPRPACLAGSLRRGDWALLPDPRAVAWWSGRGLHPELPRLLVDGASWRPLDRRPGPAPLEP